MADVLTDAAKALLQGFPAEYYDRAVAAVAEGYAFCPSCVWAGMSNCGYFDECAAFIDRDGDVAKPSVAALSQPKGGEG